ncbi:hypothetical protein GGF43_004068 [Coemansia sp. RSA 2618]|nr:hypothetical protein GGF43_004068 [Coemansia sp. RSA 2618]
MYPSGVQARWDHASIIADQTLYVFGGRLDEGTTGASFAEPCISLDLSTKLSLGSALWSSTCSRNGAQLAGHAAAMNPMLNMVMMFGGSVPSDDPRVESSVHLFSAEIKFWNTPTDTGFPDPLVNHSMSWDATTGDFVVYGGQFRDSGAVSNATLRMVSDTSNHLLITSPDDPLSIVSPAPKPSSAASQSTSSKYEDEGSSSASKTRSKSSSGESTSSESGSSESDKGEKDKKESKNNVAMLGRRRQDSGSADTLMAWTNTTLPAGVSARVGHTLTAINGTQMVVLGGASKGALVGMQTLLVYDAPRQAWTQRTATGKVPRARRNHVATVVNGTMIVVHGGANANSTALADVAVLNTETWSWSQPKVAGAPAARYAHAASQAGPYMILTFGRAAVGGDSDYGIYILDTTSWQFVDQYEPTRAKLTVLFKGQHVTGGTIFGLLVASAVGLLVLLILLYIACTHYYNRHPRLDEDETDNMLPTTELRSFGRKITVRLKPRRSRRADKEAAPEQRAQPGKPPSLSLSPNISTGNRAGPSTGASPRPRTGLSANTSPSIGANPGQASVVTDDASSMRLMFDISRDSSMDLDFMGYGRPEKPAPAPVNTSRLSRRTHLDDVELPAGLRNRDPSIDVLAAEPSSWSRPTTSHSDVRQKSAHISDVLPRIVGSRLTLLPEPEAAVARYRFDELEDMPPMPIDSSHELPLPSVTGREHSNESPTLRPSVASDQSIALNRPIAPFAQSSSSLRDSIDINTVLSQNQRFYLVNPDDD